MSLTNLQAAKVGPAGQEKVEACLTRPYKKKKAGRLWDRGEWKGRGEGGGG